MRLLSLNGGGSCGYMTAVILSKIEEETGKSSAELFDLIAGVSTGSILAAAIGKGIPAKMIASFYKELASDIFKKKCWLPWKAWYSADKLNKITKEIIGYQYNSSKTKIMIHAAAINGPDVFRPKFWKSWEECDTVMANEIVVASCSAPIYFAPNKIGSDVYIDGGFVANNPSMCAIVEALRLKHDLTEIYNLNINCGETKGFDNAHKLVSIIKWIPNISSLPTLAIKTGERSVSYQAHQLLGNRHLVIGPSIDLPMDTLDFDKMNREANRVWSINKEVILYNLQIKKDLV
jgi:patatin-like phospholipase/acyl hydrolase